MPIKNKHFHQNMLKPPECRIGYLSVFVGGYNSEILVPKEIFGVGQFNDARVPKRLMQVRGNYRNSRPAVQCCSRSSRVMVFGRSENSR